MSFPTPSHPRYCPGSRTVVANLRDQIWVTCPACARLIAPMANGALFPHLDHPTRRNDAVQRALDAAGLNRREPREPYRYAEG